MKSVGRTCIACCLLALVTLGCGGGSPAPERVPTPPSAELPSGGNDQDRALSKPTQTSPDQFAPSLSKNGAVTKNPSVDPKSAAPGRQPDVADAEPVYQGKPLSTWLAMLRDTDPEFRRTGMRAVVAVGGQARQAVPYLIESLADPDAGVRTLAARALANLGPRARDGVPALVKSMADGTPEVRAAAATAIREVGPAAKTAVPSLLDAVRDDSPAVRCQAIGALIEVGVPQDKDTAERLRSALAAQKGEVDFGMEVLLALGEVGEPAVPVLIGLLSAENFIPDQAGVALTRIGEAAVPALVRALADADWRVRYRAAQTLARIGPGAKAAVTPLFKCFEWKEREWDKASGEIYQDYLGKLTGQGLVRTAVAEAIGAIQPEGDIAALMPRLVKMLSNNDPQLGSADREEAAKHIAALRPGTRAKEAVGLLAKGLEREYDTPSGWNLTGQPARMSGTSINFIRALGAIGPDAKPALELIRRGLKHDNPSVRLAAVDAWLRVSPDDPSPVEPVLLDLLRQRADPPLPWGDAARLLPRVGPKARLGGADVLKGHLASADVPTRMAAAEALLVADVEGKVEAAKVLIELTSQRTYRLTAARTLASVSPTHRPEAVTALVDVYQKAGTEYRDRPWAVVESQRAALEALRQIDPRAARRVKQ